MNSREEPSNVRCQRWIVLGVLVAVCGVGACASQATKRPDHEPKSPKEQLESNLIQGATLLSMYAHSHEGRYPGSLEAIREVTPFYKDIMVNPVNGKRFVYVGGGLRLTDDEKVLLIAPDDDGKGGTAITVDGKIRSAKSRDYEQGK